MNITETTLLSMIEKYKLQGNEILAAAIDTFSILANGPASMDNTWSYLHQQDKWENLIFEDEKDENNCFRINDLTDDDEGYVMSFMKNIEIDGDNMTIFSAVLLTDLDSIDMMVAIGDAIAKYVCQSTYETEEHVQIHIDQALERLKRRYDDLIDICIV